MDLSFGNVWAILIAALINMVIGAIWYSPVLYGKAWMKLVNKKDMQGGNLGYAASAAFSVVTACVISALVTAVNASSFWEGAYLGFLLWVGFVATTHAVNYIFEGRPRQLYTISVGYPLVSLVVMAGLIASWR